MSGKKTNSRHAEPKPAIMLRRIDRKLNEVLKNQESDDWTRSQLRRVLRQNDRLRQELGPERLLEMARADAFVSAPLKAGPVTFTGSAPESRQDAAPDHHYLKSNRCAGCGQLKDAIDASDLPCVDPLGDTA